MTCDKDVFENKGTTFCVLEKEPATHIGFCWMIPRFSPIVANDDLCSVIELGRALYAIMIMVIIR